MATRHNNNQPINLTRLTKLVLIASFVALLTSSAGAFAGVAVGIGVNVGFAPPPVPVAVAPIAACPGAGFVWVGGHYGWYPGIGYRWAAGSWIRPPFAHAAWVGPRFVAGPHGRVFYRGYWRR